MSSISKKPSFKSPSRIPLPLILSGRKDPTPVIVEKSIPPTYCRQENFASNGSNENFEEYGSGMRAAARQQQLIDELKIQRQMEAETASLRGSRAMAENWWRSHCASQDGIQSNQVRLRVLEYEKKRLASLTPSKHILSDVSNEKSLETATRTQVNYATRYTEGDSENAFISAAIIVDMEKKKQKEYQELEEKQALKAHERFKLALNKSHLQREYSDIMSKLSKEERQYYLQDAQTTSGNPANIPPKCAPVDKFANAEKQEKLENNFKKAMKQTKEHAIEDIEGYKDLLEERFTRKQVQTEKENLPPLPNFDSLLKTDSFEENYFRNREDTASDINNADVLNTAYFESPPQADTSRTDAPQFKLSLQKTRKVKTRDYGIQVDVPVAKGVQVDLLPADDRFDADNAISRVHIRKLDHHQPHISIGSQTDPVFIVKEPVVVIQNPITTVDSSNFNSPSYRSLTTRHTSPRFPSLFAPLAKSPDSLINVGDPSNYTSTCPKASGNGNAQVSSDQNKVLPATNDNVCPVKYFPPLSTHIQNLAKKYGITPKNILSEETNFPTQAIPLSEPCFERPSVTSLVDGESASNVEALNILHKGIKEYVSREKDYRDYLPTPSDNKSTKTKDPLPPDTYRNRICETIDSPSSYNFSQDPSLSKSFPDIRKEELMYISTVMNLSDVEISRESQIIDVVNKPIEPANSTSSIQTASRSFEHTVSNNKGGGYQDILKIVHNQLKKLHPAVEISSLSDTSDDIRYDEAIKEERLMPNRKHKFCYLPSGQQYIYHELSTIQELDSSLAEKSLEGGKLKNSGDYNQNKSRSMNTTRTSLTTNLADISHVLENVEIVAQESNSVTSPVPEVPNRGFSITSRSSDEYPMLSCDSSKADREVFSAEASVSSKSVSNVAKHPYLSKYNQVMNSLFRDISFTPPSSITESKLVEKVKDDEIKVQRLSDDDIPSISELSQMSLDLNQGSLTLLNSTDSSERATLSTILSKSSSSENFSMTLKHTTSQSRSFLPINKQTLKQRSILQSSFEPLTLITNSSKRNSGETSLHIPLSISTVLPVATSSSELLMEPGRTVQYTTSSRSMAINSMSSAFNIREQSSARNQGYSNNFSLKPLSGENCSPSFKTLSLNEETGIDEKMFSKNVSGTSNQGSLLHTESEPQLPVVAKNNPVFAKPVMPLLFQNQPSSNANSIHFSPPENGGYSGSRESFSSCDTESYKSILQKSVSKSTREYKRYEPKFPNKLITQSQGSSSSDESLSHMFTKSRIAHSSTPIAIGSDVSQNPSDKEDTEIVKSTSRSSFSSLHSARYFLSKSATKLQERNSLEESNTITETLVETEIVVVQSSTQSATTITSTDTKMSNSMLSFLQHEESAAVLSPEMHVSLLSPSKLYSVPEHKDVKPPTCNVFLSSSGDSSLELETVKPDVENLHTPEETENQVPEPVTTSSSRAVFRPFFAFSHQTPSTGENPSLMLSSPLTQLSFRSDSGASSGVNTPTSCERKFLKQDYKKRTRRLWNNLEEVRAKQERERKKKMILENKEKVKELQMKIQKKRKLGSVKK